MRIRTHRFVRDVHAGCSVCGAEWSGGNAQGVAARHFDATGHETWVEIGMTIRYMSPEANEAESAHKRAVAAATVTNMPSAS